MNRSLISAGSPEPGIFDLPRKLASPSINDVQVWFYAAAIQAVVIVCVASLLEVVKNELVNFATNSTKIFENKAHLSWLSPLAFLSEATGCDDG